MKIAIAVLTLFCPPFFAPSDPASLRALGPAVVDEIIANGAPDEVLDEVCAQKDCRASRLFWYTDLEEAKAAAREQHKPILSLRLLGRLDEEVSCANSRFFRTILYPDPQISSLMRDAFVLHWESVRSVPTITIELGDGRVIRQTITGNSIHYLLDENGDVLDALPGMNSPAAFHAQLEAWTELQRRLDRTNDRAEELRQFHFAAMQRDLDVRNQYGAVPLFFAPKDNPKAIDASKLALTKSAIEVPVLTKLDPNISLRELPQPIWDRIGDAEKNNVVFSRNALELMSSKQTLSDAMLDQLRANIAADTVLNQGELHYRIHTWFLSNEVTDVESLNERVYRELFLTPLDDPWMGLKPATVYAALEE